MKRLILLFSVVCSLQAVYGQLPVLPPGVGRSVVGAASSIGRGLYQAKSAQQQERQQEELDYMYITHITLADTFYVHQQYEKAISHYQQALELKNEQYPKDRLALATTGLARQNNDPYQLKIDTADSLYRLMEYETAIVRYNEAIALKSEQYPKDRIVKANTELARWKTVQFSGLPIAGQRFDDQTSGAFSDDPWSDFLLPGNYEWVDRVLTYANFQELDGIAVPPRTHLVIYSERQFKGTVLLDVTGPAIIRNSTGMQPGDTLSESYTIPALQAAFPPSVRSLSTSDMHTWVNGSMRITTLKE